MIVVLDYMWPCNINYIKLTLSGKSPRKFTKNIQYSILFSSLNLNRTQLKSKLKFKIKVSKQLYKTF